MLAIQLYDRYSTPSIHILQSSASLNSPAMTGVGAMKLEALCVRQTVATPTQRVEKRETTILATHAKRPTTMQLG